MNVRKILIHVLYGGIFSLLLFAVPQELHAARLFLSPSSGTFVVGGTFNVDILLDTEGESVNAFEVFLQFPPDKLQITSPSTGDSIVRVWTGAPQYNNRTGLVEFQGGVPGGLNVKGGLIARLTFRVNQVGTGVVKFQDKTRVLLNDGKGTDALERAQSGVYDLVLPPPAGPIVASETHPEQSIWYPVQTAILRWGGDAGASGYSYVLSETPVDVPDNISEGANASVAYKNLANGTHYFHVKARRGGVWGGITHFAFNVDTEPPAEFPVEVIPSARTTSKSPILSFRTTDAHSGMDHYELKVIPLSPGAIKEEESAPFFIETEEQHILDLELGAYDVIVRAYDKAGNVREVTQRVDVVTPFFKMVNGEGLRIKDTLTLPWPFVFILVVVLLVLLGYWGWKARKWHYSIAVMLHHKRYPPGVGEKLDKLKKYQEKYGNLSVFLLLFASLLFFGGGTVHAQEVRLSPPFVGVVSQNISNEEIFYVGGKTDTAGTDVVIYLQNLHDGTTISQTVTSDNRNDWFYRHTNFLSTGEYLLWAQTKIGDELSPPSPQINLAVRSTAIQFGGSRLSYEVLYLTAMLIFFAVTAGLVGYIVFHVRGGRRRHALFMKEVREAEESVRRGFAVLKRDIEAELAIVHKAKLSKALTDEEKRREEQLLKDLQWAEQYIGKEIWDIEKTDHH